MKHIFYIHSYITYFVSLQIIKHAALELEGCIFLYGRGFRPKKSHIKVVELDSPFTHYPTNTFAVRRSFWESWFKLRYFDKFISKVTREGCYHLYTNQTGIDFIRLLKRHKKCAGFSILEEGVYSYYTLEQLNSTICPPVGKPSMFFRLLQYVNFYGRLELDKFYIDPKYSKVYGISEEAFPSYPRREILPFPFEYITEREGATRHVLVFDSFLEYGVVGGTVFKNALRRAFDYFKDHGINDIYVKFHPEQYATSSSMVSAKRTLELFKGGITLHEIGKDDSLELIASDKSISKLICYVFLSSAGMYAAMCGRTAISFANFIADDDPAYEERVKSLPKVYKDLVKFV